MFAVFEKEKETGLRKLLQKRLGLFLGTGNKINWRFPANDPRSNCGTHFGSSSRLVLRVVNGYSVKHRLVVSVVVLRRFLFWPE